MTLIRYKTLALSSLILGGLGTVTAPLWAQEEDATGLRGIQLHLGIEIGLESQSNRDLATSDPGGTTELSTALTVGLLSETRNQRLAFDLGGELRALNGPTNDQNGFANPFAVLSYDRSSVASRLSLSASVRESDLNNDGFEFDETTLAFTVVNGTATRRNINLSAEMNWRDDAPFGFGALARLEDNSYRGGVANTIGGGTLDDTRRVTLGVTARFDINEVTRLNSALTYSGFESDSVAGTRDTWTLSNDLTVDQPRGNLTFGFDITDTPEGTRLASTVGRSLEYPLGVVSGQLGLTRGVNGETVLNGGLNLTRELPRGNLNLDLARTVNSGALADTEQVSTSMRLGYLHEINPVSNLSVDINWAEVKQTGTGQNTTNASIQASYMRELTTDWGMNVGVRHRFRDDSVTGSARSNEVFLNLRRDFMTRF